MNFLNCDGSNGVDAPNTATMATNMNTIFFIFRILFHRMKLMTSTLNTCEFSGFVRFRTLCGIQSGIAL